MDDPNYVQSADVLEFADLPKKKLVKIKRKSDGGIDIPARVKVKKPEKETVLWFCPDVSDNDSVIGWAIHFKNGNSPFNKVYFAGAKGEIVDSGQVRADLTGAPGTSAGPFPYTVVLIHSTGSTTLDPDVVVDM